MREPLEELVDEPKELPVAILLVLREARAALWRLREKGAQEVGVVLRRVETVTEVLDVARVEHLFVLVADGYAEDRLAEVDGLADERQPAIAHDGLGRLLNRF